MPGNIKIAWSGGDQVTVSCDEGSVTIDLKEHLKKAIEDGVAAELAKLAAAAGSSRREALPLGPGFTGSGLAGSHTFSMPELYKYLDGPEFKNWRSMSFVKADSWPDAKAKVCRVPGDLKDAAIAEGHDHVFCFMDPTSMIDLHDINDAFAELSSDVDVTIAFPRFRG